MNEKLIRLQRYKYELINYATNTGTQIQPQPVMMKSLYCAYKTRNTYWPTANVLCGHPSRAA